MTRDELVSHLKTRFELVGHGLEFAIVHDGVRQEADWWYVPVIATRRGHGVAREVSVNIYANVEDEFEQQHGVSVLIIPVVAEPVAP